MTVALTPYFGEIWADPRLDGGGGMQVPTPVGVACGYCQVQVVASDQGLFAGMYEDAEGQWHDRPVHRACDAAANAGG